ncbi:MAG TPA: 3-oxoacyl-ACP reductase family protein [Spirochaetia bacterium]|nr:3-oxoacyl-ACP reductase family protein [Spirochaetia bacterium]
MTENETGSREPADSELAGRTALVTGGSRGIGRAVAIALARKGADVAFAYRASEEKAQQIETELHRLGSRCMSVKADVSRSEDVSRMMDAVRERLGSPLILVNNAGVSRPQSLPEITERDWNEIVETNLTSAFLVTQAALPDMRARRWGRVINMSSVAAQLGGVVGPHYAASKAGMIGLTHSYAAILAREGITVNAVAPALIDTEMVAANARARPELIPVGRLGTVEEVAAVVVMLACNGYITGQTINVNGGWYMSS